MKSPGCGKHVVSLALCAALLLLAASPVPAGPRSIRLSVAVPDLGWILRIEEVYRVADELWIIARLERRPGVAGQVITSASDELTADLPDLPEKVFILGKTWGWANEEPYRFLGDSEALPEKLKEGELIFRRRAE